MSSIYVLSDDIILRSINNKFWALDTKKGGQYKLNSVAFDILSRLNGRDNLKKIFNDVLKTYEIAEKIFLKDFNELIEKAIINSHGDHRIAMSFAIAGLNSEMDIEDTQCIETSFPNFKEILDSLYK